MPLEHTIDFNPDDRGFDPANPDANVHFTTPDQLQTGIGREFCRAIQPFIKRLEAIEDRLEEVCDHFGVGAVAPQDGDAGEPGVTKSLTSVADLTRRAIFRQRDQGNSEALDLFQKGIALLRETGTAPAGLEEAVDARNVGRLTEDHLARLREGIQVRAEAAAKA